MLFKVIDDLYFTEITIPFAGHNIHLFLLNSVHAILLSYFQIKKELLFMNYFVNLLYKSGK